MYKRILLKITGELFADDGHGIEYEATKRIATKIAYLKSNYKIDIGVVIGAGNLFRGKEFDGKDFSRIRADLTGMMGTIMNGNTLLEMLERLDVESRLMSSLTINKVSEEYVIPKALSHLSKGRVVVLAGGLGRPFTTTDTAAAQFAAELGCDALLKGTGVKGVYDSDPKTNPDAVMYETLTYQEALVQGLTVMDDTAFALCKTNKIPIIVFDIRDLDNIERIVRGEKVGTLVS